MLFALLNVIFDDDKKRLFERIYCKYHLSVYNVARSITGSETEGEEVASRVWYELATKLDELDFSEEEATKAYIYIMTASRASDAMRKRSPDFSLDQIQDVPSDDPTPDVCAITGETFTIINEAVKRLSVQDRHILTLKILNKMSPYKISKFLKISKNTVYTSVKRSKKLLNAALKEAKHI